MDLRRMLRVNGVARKVRKFHAGSRIHGSEKATVISIDDEISIHDDVAGVEQIRNLSIVESCRRERILGHATVKWIESLMVPGAIRLVIIPVRTPVSRHRLDRSFAFLVSAFAWNTAPKRPESPGEPRITFLSPFSEEDILSRRRRLEECLPQCHLPESACGTRGQRHKRLNFRRGD
jgi:hypothetical protein